MEVKNVATTVLFAVTDPKLITVDFNKIEAFQQQTREAREKANPPKPEPMRVEYNRLRQQLYGLQQQAKNAEVYRNNKADVVKGLEYRINDLLRHKKQAIVEGHLGQERVCEHQLQRLETELVDAKEEFNKAEHWNAQAARALKAFDGHGRIAELKLLLDSPVAK